MFTKEPHRQDKKTSLCDRIFCDDLQHLPRSRHLGTFVKEIDFIALFKSAIVQENHQGTADVSKIGCEESPRGAEGQTKTILFMPQTCSCTVRTHHF